MYAHMAPHIMLIVADIPDIHNHDCKQCWLTKCMLAILKVYCCQSAHVPLDAPEVGSSSLVCSCVGNDMCGVVVL